MMIVEEEEEEDLDIWVVSEWVSSIVLQVEEEGAAFHGLKTDEFGE